MEFLGQFSAEIDTHDSYTGTKCQILTTSNALSSP